jgi:hypothetical protein
MYWTDCTRCLLRLLQLGGLAPPDLLIFRPAPPLVVFLVAL